MEEITWVYCERCKEPTRYDHHLTKRTVEGKDLKICGRCDQETCKHVRLGKVSDFELDDKRQADLTVQCVDCFEYIECHVKADKKPIVPRWE